MTSLDHSNYEIDELLNMRQEKDEAFRHPSYSPLTAEQRKKFNGLRYFPANPTLVFDIEARLFSSTEQTMQKIMTSTNEIRHYQRWARLEFSVNGEMAWLTLYRDPVQDGFFLPFTDATSGHETYGAGRYVEIEPLEESSEGHWRLRLDFNAAYSPYCAYNSRWSCPFVPKENHLNVAINAGEMSPSEAWAAH